MDGPAKEAEDPEIVKFAIENNLIIVTKDIKMIDECEFEKVEYVTMNDIDFARKVANYSKL